MCSRKGRVKLGDKFNKTRCSSNGGGVLPDPKLGFGKWFVPAWDSFLVVLSMGWRGIT